MQKSSDIEYNRVKAGGMKVGDLVRFRHLDPSWGEIGLITDIKKDEGVRLGLITFMTPMLMQCTIPWSRRNTYIKEVLNESR